MVLSLLGLEGLGVSRVAASGLRAAAERQALRWPLGGRYRWHKQLPERPLMPGTVGGHGLRVKQMNGVHPRDLAICQARWGPPDTQTQHPTWLSTAATESLLGGSSGSRWSH